MPQEDYKRQLNAKEFQSYAKHSPFREPLEHLFNTLIRLGHEEYLDLFYVHRVRDISGYRNGYKTEGIANASSPLNLQASQISFSIDTSLYSSTLTSGQRVSCGKTGGYNLLVDSSNFNTSNWCDIANVLHVNKFPTRSTRVI